MPVSVGCPGCGQALKVPDDAWGKEVPCPYCETRFVLAVVAAEALPPRASVENVPLPEPPPTPSMEKDACEGSGAITHSPILRPATPPPLREPDRRLAARVDRGRERSLVRRGDHRGKQSLVILAASIAGALLVAGIVAAVLIFRGDGTTPESDWQEFTVPDGSCSVQMPGTPVPMTQKMNGLTIQKYIVVRGKDRVEFGVAYADVPAGMFDLTAAAALERDGLKGMLGAEVAGERALSLGSHPGREFRLKTKTKGSVIERLYLARRGRSSRVFIVLANGPGIDPEKGDAVKFFDSFKILSADPPAGPVVGGPPPPRPGPDRPPPPRPGPDRPPPPEPPPGPWADAGPPPRPAPGADSRMPVTFPSPAPVAVRPPDLGGDKLVVPLGGEVADVAVGGRGRYLVLHLPAQRQLAVFDVSAAKVVKQLPTSSDNLKLAASMNKLAVVYPGADTVERWSLTTFEREATAALTMKVPPVAVALGSASDGPLVISGCDYPRLGETVFFDIRTMRRLEMPFDPHRFFETNSHAFLRASADGRTFACQAQAGATIHSCVLSGGQLQSYRGMAGNFPVPGPDGILYTSDGCYTPHWKRLSLSGSRRVPAHHGPYYLSLPGGENRTVRVHLTGDNHSFVTLNDVEGADGADASGRGLPLDKSIHLIPDANVLVTIPASRDRLVVRRLDVERALERSRLEHLVVVSRPPQVAEQGTDYVYRLVVKSSKGGVQYKLEAGPPGLTLGPDGQVSWKVPADFGKNETEVRVAVSDASGRKIVHAFTITVAADRPPRDKGS